MPGVNPWKTKATHAIYSDAWIRVEVNDVMRPDGQDATYSVVRLKGGIGVVAVDKAGRLCLVGQFRYAPGVYSWEIPKGAFAGFGGHTDPLGTAQRELREETGLTARNWSSLGAVYTLMGSTDDKVFLYHASGLEQQDPEPGPTEVISIRMVTFRRFLEMLANEEVTDATSIAAVLLAAQRGLLPTSAA